VKPLPSRDILYVTTGDGNNATGGVETYFRRRDRLSRKVDAGPS
jgi:hypothetical protein